MRKISLVAACLWLTACSDKDARTYAAELAKTLDVFVKQLDAKIAAEENAYQAEALGALRDRDDQAVEALSSKRNKESIAARRKLIAKSQTGQDVLAAVVARSGEEFLAGTAVATRADDAYRDYLRNVQRLEFESAQVGSLRAALEDLSADPKFFDLAGQYTKFGVDLRAHLDFQRCQELTAVVADLTTKVAETEKKVTAESDATKKAALQAALTGFKSELAAATQRRLNTERFKNNACERP